MAAARLRESSGAHSPSVTPQNRNRAGPQQASGKPTDEHARMKMLQEQKSGRRPRPTIRTEIKAMNTRKKSQIWNQHKTRCKLEIFH
jgi:hypothetical protein